MTFKVLIISCFAVIVHCAPQQFPHSHAQITLNKASTSHDTLHDTTHYNYHQQGYHQPAVVAAPVTAHFAPVQTFQQVSSGSHNQQRGSFSQSSRQGLSNFGSASNTQHQVPIAKFAVPLTQVSHSKSTSSHYQSSPSHSVNYAPIAPIAAIATAPVAKYAYTAPVTKYVAAPSYHHEEEEYGPAEYSFEYSVHDEHTGDIKSQKETRHGDQVQGSYMLIEPDGSRRVVEYSSDKHTGFNAIVHHETVHHTTPVKAAVIAPVAVKYAAPAHLYH